MMLHLLKLVWQRKSHHLLLSLEILLAFMVVFALCATAGHYYQLFHMPTGLNHESRWQIMIEGQKMEDFNQNPVAESASSERTTTTVQPLMAQFQRALKQIPAVQQVGFSDMLLYDLSNQNNILRRADNSQSLDVNVIAVSDDFFQSAGLQLTAGRGFNATDNGAAHQPVVIDQRLADTLFPDVDPIGQLLRYDDDSSTESFQIVGLVNALRTQGELMGLAPTVITRLPEQSLPTILLLQLTAGTDRGIEQQLLQQLKQVRSDWRYNIQPLTQKRQSMLRTQMIPLMILAVLSAFLLSMVAFGLFGVLWQHTSQRIPELGLRRAIGATSGNIYWQIIAEQLLLNLLAVSVALFLLVQLPLTGVLGEHLNWPLFLMASLVATLIICLLSLVCALYPAWRASRLTPTEALHYE
jgi:putative ABC transport system permease protein